MFLARHPLQSRKLAKLAGLADGTAARTLARRLNRLYDEEGSAFRVEEVAGGLQLLTRKEFAPWLRRWQPKAEGLRLSTPAQETLAVVAYRQPVLRVQIEEIRGVQCGEVLRQLMDRDLVRIVGRSKDLGRPLLYGTTRRFLQVFGLRRIEELPPGGGVGPPGSSSQIQTDRNNDRSGSDKEMVLRLDDSSQQEEAHVKMTLTSPDTATVPGRTRGGEFGPWARPSTEVFAAAKRDEDDDVVDEEEDEDEDDDELDDDFEDEDEEDEELDDEDLEDDEWEEVDDEDEEDEDEEDEDWDDDDWDEDDDDWDEDDDEEEAEAE